MRNINYFCRACFERLSAANGPTRVIAGMAYCKECGDELAEGKIGPPAGTLFFGGRPGDGKLDEEGGYQSIARKALEESDGGL